MFRTLLNNSLYQFSGGQIARTFVGCAVKTQLQKLTVSSCPKRHLKARNGGCLVAFPTLLPAKHPCLSARYFSTIQEEVPNEPSLHKASEVKIHQQQRDVLKYPNGFVYEGEMASGLPHGKGKLTLRDGMVLEGYFVKGILQGQPRSLTNPSFHYEGDVLNDKPHGRGKMTLQNGEIWEGEFCESTLTGWGKITYPDSKMEEGEFKNNKLNSRGTVYYTDGVREEANFVDHVREGVVKRTLLDGEVQESLYVRGEFQRHERHVWPNGTVVEGDYLTALENKSLPWKERKYYTKIRHGQFKFTYPCGHVKEGEIKYNYFVGPWAHTHSNGVATTEIMRLTLLQRFHIALMPTVITLCAKHCMLGVVASVGIGWFGTKMVINIVRLIFYMICL